MCGIAGIVQAGQLGDLRTLVSKMNDAAVHRGPDADGILVEGNVALGHRRLAILDLSDSGKQPMAYGDDLAIVHNGEVYNYLELRTELEKAGHRFRTHTDTEVILAAYREWGPGCVSRFNGMWAFAILDRRRQMLFCSRDRFGIKPFYFAETPNALLFGSEIRQLRAVENFDRANESIVADYLFSGMEDHREQTFVAGIQRLPSSHNLYVDLSTRELRTEKYYDLRHSPLLEGLTDCEATEQFRDLFADSIRLRLRSDVKVGTCLSGGLDSSSIAAAASGPYREVANSDFMAIHARALEEGRDESHFARMVADQHRLDLVVEEPQTEDFLNLIDEVVDTQEEPFGGPSIFMQYLTFKSAKKHGCTVMLDGQGADEAFFGYEAYYVTYMSYLLSVSTLGSFVTTMRDAPAFKISRAQAAKKALAYKLRRDAPGAYRLAGRLVGRGLKASRDTSLKQATQPQDVREYQICAIEATQLPRLLRFEDKNSMRHSVESRLPFMDYRLVEFAIGIEMRHKVRDGYQKYVMRLAADDTLPQEISWRRDKYGFEAPIKTWLKALSEYVGANQPNNRLLDDMLHRHQAQGQTLDPWRLFNMTRWLDLNRISDFRS